MTNDIIGSVCISGNLDMLKLFIEYGYNIHTDDDFALRMSSANGITRVVDFLLQNGANVHTNDEYSLQISVYSNHMEVVRLLLKHGANVHVNNDDPLRQSFINRNFEMMDLLVEYGADIKLIMKEMANKMDVSCLPAVLFMMNEKYQLLLMQEMK